MTAISSCTPETAACMVAAILNDNPELSQATAVILQEYLRARKLHPCWPTDAVHAVNVITEEVGELAKDANDFHWRGGSSADRAGMRDEAIQVGAMAVRFLANLNGYVPNIPK